MKKIKWRLLLVAVLAISTAFTTRSKLPTDFHKYIYLYHDANLHRYYVLSDLTSLGLIQGWDYDCVGYPNICSLVANPVRQHHDGSGNWFADGDVPITGLDTDGIWVPMQW